MNNEKYIEQKRDDSKDLVTIDYYDRIHKKWIKVEVTKEVARFMKSNGKKTRRKQNKYNFRNIPLSSFETEDDDYSFDVEDESSDIEGIIERQELDRLDDIEFEYERTLIENSLYCLTSTQRKVVEMVFVKKMSYGDIAKELQISKTAVWKIMQNSRKKIKNHIKNSQN